MTKRRQWFWPFSTKKEGAKVEQNVEQNQKLERKQFLQNLIELAPGFIERIGRVTYREGDFDSAEVTGATSLPELLALHKELWEAGFQNKNLEPCSDGMFRTNSIPTMSPEEVYLGNTCGLNTNNIPFWDKYQNEGKTGGGYTIYMYLTVYQIILNQYKKLLSSNVRAIAKSAEKELEELEKSGF